MTHDRLSTLLRELAAPPRAEAARAGPLARRVAWLSSANEQEVAAVLDAVEQLVLRSAATEEDPRVQAILPVLEQGWRRLCDRSRAGPLDARKIDSLAQIYRRLGHSSRVRHHLLGMLTASGQPTELTQFTELVVIDPPHDPNAAAWAFGRLFQRPTLATTALFPRLLDALAHTSVASMILDLANLLTRKKLVARHPATPRCRQLTELLGALVGRLSRFESPSRPSGPSPAEAARTVTESVALAVSLCDTLGLIGDRSAVGKLYQAMELRHRRLRTEAAAALARLGEEPGRKALVELAAEPVARLRVLAYAEELGCAGEIDEQYRSPAARAAAELVTWLAEPLQVGVAPATCDLIDTRTRYWPGYDDPITCFLFRFSYSLPQGHYSNVGLAGPLVHSFAADLNELPLADMYAAFAGWQADHADIHERDFADLEPSQRVLADRLRARLEQSGYSAIEPAQLGFFFGETVLIAAARRSGVSGTAMVDAVDTYWCPAGNPQRPIGHDLAYCIYKGRKLLSTFNPE